MTFSLLARVILPRPLKEKRLRRPNGRSRADRLLLLRIPSRIGSGPGGRGCPACAPHERDPRKASCPQHGGLRFATACQDRFSHSPPAPGRRLPPPPIRRCKPEKEPLCAADAQRGSVAGLWMDNPLPQAGKAQQAAQRRPRRLRSGRRPPAIAVLAKMHDGLQTSSAATPANEKTAFRPNLRPSFSLPTRRGSVIVTLPPDRPRPGG